MKTLILILLLLLMSFACQITQPSSGEIQTAIARTQSNVPTRETTPTQEIPLPEASMTPPRIANTPITTEEPIITQGGPRLIWSNPGFSSKAIVDGIVYGYLYKEEKVQAIEIATGNIIWESATGGEVIGADRDYVYVSPATQRLDALSIKDGETKWRALLPSRPGKILVSQPNFIMVGGLLSNDLFKIDKNDGNILTELTDQNQTPLKENILLVGFSGVDITTGKVVWDLTNIHPNAIKICGDEVIYNRLDNGEQPSIVVEAIDITTADLLWRTDFPNDKVPNDIVPWDIQCPGDISVLDRIGTTIAVDPTSQNIYIMALADDRVNPSEDYYLAAFDMNSGQLQWNNNKYKSWLGEAGGLVIYTQPEFGLIQAYDAKAHRLVWENDQVLLAGLVGNSGDTIIGITDCCPNIVGYSGFVGLDVHKGELLWELEENQIAPGLIDDRAKILFGYFIYSRSNEKNLIFINPKTGSVEAEINLEREPYSFTAQEGYIFVNDGDFVIVP